MRLPTAVALALSILLAAFTVGAAIAPATAATAAAEPSTLSAASSQPATAALASSIQDADRSDYRPERADPWQVIRLDVSDGGDVRWTLESRFVVADDETDEFREYAEAVTEGDRDVGYDVDQYDRFREDAERATGREMSFENETWEEPRLESLEDDDRQLGVISYSFTWTNFAVVEEDEDRIRFGDAFETEDGVWLPYLEEGQRFVVESDYSVITAPSRVQDNTLVYDGYRALEANDFRIVFDSDGPTEPNNSTPSEPGSEPDPESPDESDSLFSAERVAAAFGGFVLFIVTASLIISRYQRSAWPFDDGAGDEPPAVHARPPETDGSGAATAPAPVDGGVEHEFDETEAISESPSSGSAGEVDVDLLSDEERVRRLLERNGGRMKQATIVKETGWSDAKVSQLLSDMDDEDEIEKLRIGRENLITLPDVDPTELD